MKKFSVLAIFLLSFNLGANAQFVQTLDSVHVYPPLDTVWGSYSGNVDTVTFWLNYGPTMSMDSMAGQIYLNVSDSAGVIFFITPNYWPAGDSMFTQMWAGGDSIPIPSISNVLGFQTPCPTITITSVSGTYILGSPLSGTSQASGGTGPYTYAVDTVPPGATFNITTGVWGGALLVKDTFVVTITATDANSCVGIEVDTLIGVCGQHVVNALTKDSAALGIAFADTSEVLSGAIGSSVFQADTVPQGLTYSSSGVWSGAPTALGTFIITVTETDSAGCTGQDTDTLTTHCGQITIQPLSVDSIVLGVTFSDTSEVQSGGISPFSWSADTVPQGMTYPSSGVLSGAATAQGTYIITRTVTDSLGCTGTRTDTLTTYCGQHVVNALTKDSAAIGIAFADTSEVLSGAVGSSMFQVDSVPQGMTYSSSGVWSGAPTALGTFIITVTETDSAGCTGQDTDTLTTYCAGTITVSGIADGVVDMPYSDTLTAISGIPPFTYAIDSLPDGLSLTDSIISGYPTTVDTFVFTITVTDSLGCTGQTIDTMIVDTLALALVVDSASAIGMTGDSVYVSYSGNPGTTTIWANYALTMNMDSMASQIYSVSDSAGQLSFFVPNYWPNDSVYFQSWALPQGMITVIGSNVFRFKLPFIPDTIAPIISDLVISNITSSGAEVHWNTNEEANTQAGWGLTDTSFVNMTTLDPAMVTSHHVDLSGLTADTKYYVVAISYDTAGNVATLVDSFTTGLAPSVEIYSAFAIGPTGAAVYYSVVTSIPINVAIKYDTTSALGVSSKMFGPFSLGTGSFFLEDTIPELYQGKDYVLAILLIDMSTVATFSSDTVGFSTPVGIDKPKPCKGKSIRVSPNPVSTSESLYIDILCPGSRGATFVLFNAIGVEVKRLNVKGRAVLEGGDLPPGLYYYRLQTEHGLSTGKIVIQ